MLKVTVVALSLLSGVVLHAQERTGRVSINTDSPNATLDIRAINSDNAKGVLVPRISVEEMKAMTPKLTTLQNSLMTFLTEEFPSAERTGNYELVNDAGFYYWDAPNARWVHLIEHKHSDLRRVGTNNHITIDAGFGGTGTSVGTGENNVAMVAGALSKIEKGDNNIGIGLNAGRDLKEGSGNIAIGANVLRESTASPNLAVGSHAMLRNISGKNNVAMGSNALRANSTGENNVAIGINTLADDEGLKRNTGSNNVAIGSNALFANSTGKRNFGLGDSALKSNTTGESNIAVGTNALSQLETGKYNIAMGDLALEQLKGANKNYNIAIGYSAGLSGYEKIGGGVIILGNNSVSTETDTFKDIYKDTTKTNNAVALGNFVDVSRVPSNTVVIGNDKATGNTEGGTNVGIGVYEPKAKLDVNGGVKVGNDPRVCNDNTRGVIRYIGGNFEGCTANGWVQLNNP